MDYVSSLHQSEKRFTSYLQPLARLPNMLLFLTYLSENRQLFCYFKKYTTESSTYKHLQQASKQKAFLITYDTLRRPLLLIINIIIHLGTCFHYANRSVSDWWKYQRKMEQQFPIKPDQSRRMALTISHSFSKFPE